MSVCRLLTTTTTTTSTTTTTITTSTTTSTTTTNTTTTTTTSTTLAPCKETEYQKMFCKDKEIFNNTDLARSFKRKSAYTVDECKKMCVNDFQCNFISYS